jgi:transcriptional regulator with XRE-family HTH domain
MARKNEPDSAGSPESLSQDGRKSDHGSAVLDSDKLKSLRIQRGWSQKVLAKKAGCDEKTIENAENRRPVRLKTINAIATALGVKPEDLILVSPAGSQPAASTVVPLGRAPRRPDLVIGREGPLRYLEECLCLRPPDSSSVVRVITAVQGCAGIGKTTVARELAHRPDMVAEFPEVLWVALGLRPNVLACLRAWASALGILEHLVDVEQASSRITAVLRDRRVLLIVDDIWDDQDLTYLKVGGHRCASLLTTRVTAVARKLAAERDIYVLPGLDDAAAVELLEALAPKEVTPRRNLALELARALGGSPLGLQVAGRLLRAEGAAGSNIELLVQELRTTARILREKPPSDVANETNTTVDAVFNRSTDRLDSYARDCFASLGAFDAEPGSFDLNAMRSVWRMDDPWPLARLLIDLGLLEPIGDGRFQIHELLRIHARFLLQRSPASKEWQQKTLTSGNTP